MHVKTKNAIKKNVVNAFGAFGYLSIMVQLLWAVVLYSGFITTYLPNVTPKVEQPVVTHASPIVIDERLGVIVAVIGVIITIAVIALSIYVLIKTPSTIVKTAKKVVYETAEVAAPVILHVQHKQDTVVNHRKLTINLRVIVKIMLVLLPFIAALVSLRLETTVFNATITLYGSIALMGITLVWFAIQYSLARILHVKKQDIW